MIEKFPVMVYDESRFLRTGGFYSSTPYLKEIICTISGIPDIPDFKEIVFTDQIERYQWEFYQRSISFRIHFNSRGEIGLRFLHSSLIRSRYWCIESFFEDSGPDGCFVNVELSCKDFHENSMHDFLNAINTEINTEPKWVDFYDSFGLIFTGEFHKIK